MTASGTVAPELGLAPDRDWWRDAVVYQVYPRSFADADGDGLGDIAGVASRIPVLQRLGVDAIWLSPFYPSALADGGYDVIDYRDVDPRLGTLDDFDALVDAAHKASLRIIVDIVPNHTSNLHERFQAALRAKSGSPERAWYVFRDGRGADGSLPPSDWQSQFGGSAWERVPDGQWYLHLYTREQPDLNWEHPEVRAEFLDVLRFWSNRGVDGFRIDVAHGLAKDLSEPMRPSVRPLPLDGSDPLFDRDAVHEIFREWRRVLDEYDPPRSAIAEAWVPASRRPAYARPDELGQAFNFDLLTAPFDAPRFRAIIDENLAGAAASGASSTWVLSNHDVVRHPTRYGLPDGIDVNAWLLEGGPEPPLDRARGLRRARAATLLLLALPGSAYLYQGEELGLFEVADLPESALQDPIWERTGHARKGRDGSRVPLPWRAHEPGFGFGSAHPWLPQPAWFEGVAADAQEDAPESTLTFYRAALALRRALLAEAGMSREAFAWVDTGDERVVTFRRGGTDRDASGSGWISATNFDTRPAPLPRGTLLLSSAPTGGEPLGGEPRAELPGETTVWLRPDIDAGHASPDLAGGVGRLWPGRWSSRAVYGPAGGRVGPSTARIETPHAARAPHAPGFCDAPESPDTLDRAGGSRRAGQSCVARDEGRAESLGERDVRRVIARQVAPELPRTCGEEGEWPWGRVWRGVPVAPRRGW